MSPRYCERCPGCGRQRLLFPGGLCLDCRDNGGVQLVFDLNDPAGAPTAPAPVLSPRVPAGAARLLKQLLIDGLDPDALAAAAAIVAALDEGLGAEQLDSEMAA
jgi:hypothetical protein